MRVDLTMPQMGESIAEGTISRWRKRVGEQVERDEPIVEISTDKVDAEIPSPAAGRVVELRSAEGETVPVHHVIAVIETAGDVDVATPPTPAVEMKPAREAPAPTPVPAPARRAEAAGDGGGADQERAFVSPVVRRMAAEHGIDPATIPGTGAGGRVTKQDLLRYLEAGGAPAAPAAPAPAAAPATSRSPAVAEPVTRERLSVMRKRIAERMVESRRISAHVHTVFEVDATRLVQLRERHRQGYTERHGVKLTYTPFFVRAVCSTLPEFPLLNASLEGDEIVYHREIHIGVAVALDWGLIVPVVRNADRLSLAGIAVRLNDLASRARAKKLNPDEVQDANFTLTNPGQFGGLYGLPIIQQPQLAILGVGGIHKRPVVIDDAIAIRSRVHLALSFDHRAIDGAVADRFMAAVRDAVEGFDESVL